MYDEYLTTSPDYERISFMWRCHGRLHIYQDSAERIIKLCESLLVFGNNDFSLLSSMPSADVVAEHNMWAEEVAECLQQWSNMELIATLVRWDHIRSVLNDLYRTCPETTRMADQSGSSPVFQPSLSETIEAVKAALSSKQEVRSIVRLERSDALPVIDLLDQVMILLPPESDLYKTSFHTLRKLCSRNEHLPKSFMISGKLRKTGEQPAASGSFADVWQGRYGDSDVALKSIRVSGTDNVKKIMESFCKEAIVWRHLSHPNVIPFLGIDTTLFRLCMVSLWAVHGNIRTFLRNNPRADRSSLILDIAHGLEYLHSNDITHGDLKGANILIDHDFRACLSDFGLTRIVYNDDTISSVTARTAASGSVRWMAPEILDPERFGIQSSVAMSESDIHSFGMVMWEVYTNRNPFDGIRIDAAVIYQIIAGTRPKLEPATIRTDFFAGVSQIMEACWQPDWRERPDISVVVSRLCEILPFPSFLNAPSASDRSIHDQANSHLVLQPPPLEPPNLTSMHDYAFIPHVRSVIRSPTVSFHPWLDGQTFIELPLSFDLARNAFQPLLPDVTGRSSYTRPSRGQLEEYATDPAVRRMTILCDAIPQWPILVGARESDGRPLSGTGLVTVQDVLLAIFNSMRTQINHAEWTRLSFEDQRAVTREFGRRCQAGSSPLHQDMEHSQGVRRVDFLRGRHVFKGLIYDDTSRDGFDNLGVKLLVDTK